LCELHAGRVPARVAARFVERTHESAADFIAAKRHILVFVAATASLWIAAERAAAAHRADVVRDRCADLIPHCVAAGGVDIADFVTAILVVAVCVVVGEAAVAGLGRAAVRRWARVAAILIDTGLRRAERIPLR